MQMARAPRFTAKQTPSEILNAGGQWLAAELGRNFRWLKSRHALSQTLGPRSMELELAPSPRSRAGFGTYASLGLILRDRRLGAWRRSHPDEALFVHDSDLLWSDLLGNIDPDLGDVELFGELRNSQSEVSFLSLGELLDSARTIILPGLLLFESPELAVERLPDAWLANATPLVEWALSLGQGSTAREIAVRAMLASARYGGAPLAEAFEAGRAQSHAGERPGFMEAERALGWLSERHQLFSSGEVLPWTVAPASEKDRLVASGYELAEQLRSELRHFPEYRQARAADAQLSEVLELLGSWIAELTGQRRFAGPVGDHALSHRVAAFWRPQTALGDRLIGFEAAAARVRRGGADPTAGSERPT